MDGKLRKKIRGLVSKIKGNFPDNLVNPLLTAIDSNDPQGVHDAMTALNHHADDQYDSDGKWQQLSPEETAASLFYGTMVPAPSSKTDSQESLAKIAQPKTPADIKKGAQLGRWTVLGTSAVYNQKAYAPTSKSTKLYGHSGKSHPMNPNLNVAAHAKKTKKAASELSDAEYNAIHSYTGSGYTSTNKKGIKVTKGKDSSAGGDFKHAVTAFRKAPEIPEGTKLWRNFSMSSDIMEAIQANPEAYIGKTIAEAAVISTSWNAYTWSRPYSLNITTAPGVRGFAAGAKYSKPANKSLGSGSAWSAQGTSEYEMVLGPGQRYQITGVRKDVDGRPTIDVVALPYYEGQGDQYIEGE